MRINTAKPKPKPKPKPAAQSAAERVYLYLVNVLHLTPGAAAGVLGNFKVESGFRPTAYNPGENAHGFAQWEGNRWSGPGGLEAYAARHHENPLTVPAQIGFLNYELTHGYKHVLDELRSTSDPTTAAHYFQRDFEGSTPDSLPLREQYARGYARQIHSGRPLTGGPLGTGTAAATGASAAGASASLTGGFWPFPNPLPGITGPLGPTPIPGVGGPLGGGGIFDTIVRPVEKWLASGVFVIVGLIMLILAVVILAKNAEHAGDSSSAPAPAPSGPKPSHARELEKVAAVE